MSVFVGHPDYYDSVNTVASLSGMINAARLEFSMSQAVIQIVDFITQ